MQFITNGPDIPEALLQAHEEGRVVFFCGAGISYPAGLPGFKGLVENIYALQGEELSDLEKTSFDRGQYDATLDLLERRLQGQRVAVRHSLVRALKPSLRRKGATATHESLLKLSRSREGAMRLVTTNFDGVFHKAAKRINQKFESYIAPMLPIPKNSRWNGIVFLHGLLDEKEGETNLNRLVLTSGDFGLAYLTERWAARFVTELFRNYVVCFVGYSINDPVLRYMMDALAADRMLGEVTPQAWAFGDCESGGERGKKIDWEAKGVTPILYTALAGKQPHSLLHETLHRWANIYSDGVMGKERIIVDHALARPSESTQQDNFVGRMLWALSDKSGLPARLFADFNPVPPLEWLLKIFSEKCYGHCDLPRFNVSPSPGDDEKFRFGLVQRPAPYYRTPFMQLVTSGSESSQWDEVMLHLARWVTRHLGDPMLIIWIAQKGGQLHPMFWRLINDALEHIDSLERNGETDEINEICTNAPKAIPESLMHALWRLLLSGQVKSFRHGIDIYQWINWLKRDGLTTSLRLSLREILSPKLALNKALKWRDEDDSELVDWELVLAEDHIHAALNDLNEECWRAALPHLVDDFQLLLRDGLDILHELGVADADSDRVYWDLPSISPHRQNKGFRDWVYLIELLRDSWVALRNIDPVNASRIAQSWFEIPYPTFKRLAFYAASHNGCIPTKVWVRWLVGKNVQWLWSLEVGREVFRLLVLQGQNLAGAYKQQLEAKILAGPPKEMFRKDVDVEDLHEITDRYIWLHLAKLNASGLALGPAASKCLQELSAAYPEWVLAHDERDEFSSWMTSTGDPDYDEHKYVERAPRTRRKLVLWLTSQKTERFSLRDDTWRDVCRTRFFHSLWALCDLAKENKWPLNRWQEALHVWSDKEMLPLSMRYVPPVLQTMPDDILLEAAHGVSWWIESISMEDVPNEETFLHFCRKVLELPIKTSTGIIHDGEPSERPVTDAINHPIGHITQALINRWFKKKPNDNDLLPDKIKIIFTELCNSNVQKFLHGRILLAAQLIALFRVDRVWTREHLLPLFSWDNPREAKAVWEGFLWSPRLFQPLLDELKPYFLDSARHYDKLGSHRQQYAALLTYAAIGPCEGYSVEEFRSAFRLLPVDGLENCARSLAQALESATEQREDYWKKKIQPFWEKIWPKSCDLATPKISESLAKMIIYTLSEFPNALAVFCSWLKPLEYPNHVMHLFYESKLCAQFPEDSLRFLKAIITEKPWIPSELGKCLADIKQVLPNVENNIDYTYLYEYSRRRGT